ncbi:MAG: hypothetical protein ABI321_18400 [Polyangia bacterium]
MYRAWLFATVVVCGAPGLARADKPTPLLEDDLRANKRTTIDAPTDADDAALDTVLGGPRGFSTQALGAAEDRLRAELKRDRPRTSPRLVVFMYPGRVSAERLKAMREVFVDIELTIDPCSRSVCDDALAHHIEMVGRAVEQPVVRTSEFSLVYKTLTLMAETDVRGEALITVSVPVADAIAASKKPGGGQALMDARRKAETDYVPLMTKAIAQRANGRRVPLAKPPSVARAAGSVDVTLAMPGERSRNDQHVLDGLAAIAEALATSPATPAQGRLEVNIEAESRSVGAARYRCPLDAAQRYARGEVDSKALLASYVEHVNDDKGAQRMNLADTPGADEGAPAPDDSEAVNAITASFSTVGGCAKAEAARNPKFHGVTVVVGWAADGRAASVDVKEPALKSGALPGCLRSAFRNIALPRFSGATRIIEYPIKLK